MDRLKLPAPVTSTDFYLHAIAAELRDLSDRMEKQMEAAPSGGAGHGAPGASAEVELKGVAKPSARAKAAGKDK
jgi:hypothetical protein